MEYRRTDLLKAMKLSFGIEEVRTLLFYLKEEEELEGLGSKDPSGNVEQDIIYILDYCHRHNADNTLIRILDEEFHPVMTRVVDIQKRRSQTSNPPLQSSDKEQHASDVQQVKENVKPAPPQPIITPNTELHPNKSSSESPINHPSIPSSGPARTYDDLVSELISNSSSLPPYTELGSSPYNTAQSTYKNSLSSQQVGASTVSILIFLPLVLFNICAAFRPDFASKLVSLGGYWPWFDAAWWLVLPSLIVLCIVSSWFIRIVSDNSETLTLIVAGLLIGTLTYGLISALAFAFATLPTGLSGEGIGGAILVALAAIIIAFLEMIWVYGIIHELANVYHATKSGLIGIVLPAVIAGWLTGGWIGALGGCVISIFTYMAATR